MNRNRRPGCLFRLFYPLIFGMIFTEDLYMKVRLTCYTMMHFLVDLTCIYRMSSLVMPLCSGYEQWLIMAVLYNFLAFALPALLGLLADFHDEDEALAALGCLLTALPFFFRRSVAVMVLLQGIGNGLFHVGAGRKLLLQAGGRYTPAGIFISSGALGVFLGTAWKHLYRREISLLLALLLLLSAFLLLRMDLAGRREKRAGMDLAGRREAKVQIIPAGCNGVKECRSTAAGGSGDAPMKNLLSLPVLLILLVVALRSFYGTAVSYEWKNTLTASLVFVVCIVAGKASGGILADRIGIRWAVWCSLGGAALTVLLSEHSMLFGCISILLFNMTMPLTLTLIAEEWSGYPGLAFGSLMLALFIGTIPDLLGRAQALPVKGLCAVSLVSLAGLLAALNTRAGGNRR